MHEVGMIMVMKLKTFKFFKDVILGMKMGLRGKLSIWPSWTKNVKEVREIFDKVREKDNEREGGAK